MSQSKRRIVRERLHQPVDGSLRIEFQKDLRKGSPFVESFLADNSQSVSVRSAEGAPGERTFDFESP